MMAQLHPDRTSRLEDAFGSRLQKKVALAPYTSSRIGGPADYLLEVETKQQLAEAAKLLWALEMPFWILGGGSNVLISDRGLRGVVILNRAKEIRFEVSGPRSIWAESGASFSSLSRLASERGWSGLEWAATVPGTVGGAVVGNAGAHDGDVAGCLRVAEILQLDGREESWSPERLQYSYRDSWFKHNPGQAVVLAAEFDLQQSSPEETKATMATFVEHRRRTQPPGASWGSMFKNPLGDFAGRLIEAAGLKGLREGQAQISEHHANFFINLGDATARDAWNLIQTARDAVRESSGVELELEVELMGDWDPENVKHEVAGGPEG